MKSSPTTTTVLILIMLLLVVAAGFVFLFQAELRFRDQLRILSADNEALRTSQASIELELAGAVATRDAVSAALATAEGDTRVLEGQLVESQQAVDELSEEIATLNDQIAALQQELADMEGEQQTQPPVARIVTPADAATLPISRPVEIVLVAGDNAGLDSLTLEVNGRRFSTYTVGGEKLYARTLTWNAPSEEGDVVFTVRAVNLNGINSRPQSITITLTDTEARNSALRAEIETAVSELRGLELISTIEPVLMSRDQLRDRFAGEFAAELTPEDARFDALSLSAFDFLGRDYDLYAAQVSLYGEGVTGFYDPDTAEFVVVSDGGLLDPGSQLTHGHEFIHALQDQHFSLAALNDDALDSEARAAARALAEGEATMISYLLINESDFYTPRELDALRNSSDQSGGTLSDFPPVLVNSLSFPYRDGMLFALDLFNNGGVDALNDAWDNPPRSTEHILHPDRYRAGDDPQIVAIAPLTDTLGVGWELIDEDIMGEFHLREYLDQQLPTMVAARVAAGWGGDRYVVFYHEADDALVMAWRLVWDDPRDALEFAEAYPTYAAALFNAETEAQPDGSACWSGLDVICYLQTDGESLVVRAPDTDTAAAVMAALRPGATATGS